MTSDFRICIDACVLANQGVCDLLLRLSETPRLICPVFSGEILEEVRHVHLTKLRKPWPPHLAEYWQEQVRERFPEAIVEGYEHLIHSITLKDEDDRHVLAAAIWGRAELIVTFNLKDFRDDYLEVWNIRAIHPQEYLTTLYEMSPDVVLSKIVEMSEHAGRKPVVTLKMLQRSVPVFSETVAEALGWELSQHE